MVQTFKKFVVQSCWILICFLPLIITYVCVCVHSTGYGCNSITKHVTFSSKCGHFRLHKTMVPLTRAMFESFPVATEHICCRKMHTTWLVFLLLSISGSLKCKTLCLTLRTWHQNCSYFAALTARELYVFSWLHLHPSATNPLILNLSAQLWQRHPYSSFAPRRPPMNHLMHISLIFIIIVAGRSGSFHFTWLKVNKCWYERQLIHVTCITLQPVSVCGWAFLSLPHLSLSNNAVQLFPSSKYPCPASLAASPTIWIWKHAVIQLSSAAGEEGRGTLDSINSDLHFRRITELDSLNSTLNRYLTELEDWKNRVQNMLHCDKNSHFMQEKAFWSYWASISVISLRLMHIVRHQKKIFELYRIIYLYCSFAVLFRSMCHHS